MSARSWTYFARSALLVIEPLGGGFMAFSVLGLVLLAALPNVELRTLEGRNLTGELQYCDSAKVRIQSADGVEELAADQVWEFVPVDSRPMQKNPAATITVQLTDGTAMLAEDFRVTNQGARIVLGAGETVTTPTAAVAHVKFAIPSDLEAQWKEILGKNVASDLVVIKKDGALDYLEGVLGPTDADGSFAFTLDGDTLTVKRTRLAGIAYFHKAGAELPAAAALVSDTHGNQFSAAQLTLNEQELSGTTPAGAEWSIPLESLAKVDFSQGRVAYLSDLQPTKKDRKPFVLAGKQFAAIESFYGAKANQSVEEPDLRVAGQRFTKGISLVSRGEVAYRLDGKYRRFQALAGIDDRTSGLGSVHLVIRGDERVLWEGDVAAGMEPQALNLATDNVRVLTIFVDYGAGGDEGDHLNLCDAKVIR